VLFVWFWGYIYTCIWFTAKEGACTVITSINLQISMKIAPSQTGNLIRSTVIKYVEFNCFSHPILQVHAYNSTIEWTHELQRKVFSFSMKQIRDWFSFFSEWGLSQSWQLNRVWDFLWYAIRYKPTMHAYMLFTYLNRFKIRVLNSGGCIFR
jgi:hypothetical protein